MFLRMLLVFFLVSGTLGHVEVSVEGGEGAFFLRPESEGSYRFAILGGEQGGLPQLKARFGPFSAQQPLRNATVAHSEHVTARLVTREVRRDRPVLRVLFHWTAEKGTRGSPPCVLLYVHRDDQHLMAACSPGPEGVCLAQATLPVSWWPPLHPKTGNGTPVKSQRTRVRVEYAVLNPTPQMECSDPNALPVSMASGLPTGIPIGEEVGLVAGSGAYEEVGEDDVVRILVPQGPVYPGSKVYVPVHVRPDPVYPPYVFVIRARVKSGLRIVGAQVAPSSEWSISVEVNPRQTIATVTAFVKDAATPTPDKKNPTANLASVQEVFTWLLEVEEGAVPGDGRISWQLRYLLDASMAEQYDFEDDEEATRIASRLDIRKDDVHALVPIAQSSHLLNTAVLTGRQVSQPMKVFVVSQAGKVGDVTLQASCAAADESILKVSPSCTSVYVDGSEVRGSQEAAVQVRYGSHAGRARFVVWMPEMPLSVRLTDARLSQIKGWRTPHPHRGKPLPLPGGRSRSSSRNDRWLDMDLAEDTACRLRFQQSSVEVFARFQGADHDSGREAFLLGRRAELRVTELVASFLRVADPRIARLVRRTALQGMQAGRTEVQVLSPITGRVMGAREVRVGGDRETITQLEVGVVTGLQVSAYPDTSLPGVFVAHTQLSHKLTSQYQEGVLDIKVHFSDGTMTALSDIADTDYHLSVNTFDGGVVAFAPVAGLPHPRVIAVGRGKGKLLHATLELAERCRKRRSQPLAMAYANVDVDFGGKSTGILNDVQRKQNKQKSDTTANPAHDDDISNHVGGNDASSILYQDAVGSRSGGRAPFREPAVQARQNLLLRPAQLTPLEIGMYALLGVFCLAILVFLVSCSVFAVRYRRKQVPEISTAAPSGGDPVAHAHDWVWLGRATLERNSVNTRCSNALLPDLNGNHPEPDDPPVSRRNGAGEKRGIRPTSDASFPGSEVSIRITTNPQELREDEVAMMDKATSTSPPTITRERRVRIVAPPHLPATNGALRLFPAHPPPPIPPHRNLPPNQRQKLRGPVTEAEWDAVSHGMDYDQLIEYFENLKESNA